MWWMVWVLVVLASLMNYAGGYLIARHQWSAVNLTRLTGISAGFLLGVAIIGMLPETLGDAHHLSLWVLGGFFLVYFAERLVTSGARHHHHGANTHAVAAVGTWIGLLVHTFLDGVAIVAAYFTGASMGVLVAIGVLLHKAADGVTMASVALVCRQGRRLALWCSASLGVATLLGALVVLGASQVASQLAGTHAHHGSPMGMALALAAGSFIYVAATDLLSLLNQESSERCAPLYVMLGTVVFLVLSRALLVLGVHHH